MDKITNFLPRLYLPLLLLLCGAYAWRPLEGGFDFWAHAAVGRWIWDQGRVPRESLFLWSESINWVYHSWLSQVGFYALLNWGGPLAVVIFNTVLPILVFFLIWRLWKREAEINFLVPVVFALAIWASAPRFQPRQELLSALLLAVLLAFLVAWSQGRFDDWLERARSLDISLVAAPLITLFFLWVNLHALVAIGLAVLWITVIADFAQSQWGGVRWGKTSGLKARTRALLAIAVLCTLATLINPYGLEYWKAAEILKPSSQARFVEEWWPFWERGSDGTKGLPPAYALIQGLLFLGAIVAWLTNPERRWSQLAWTILMAALFLRSRRMLWLAAIVFLVVIAANSRNLDSPTLWRTWRRFTKGNMLDPIPAPMRLLARLGTIICLLLWVLVAASRHTPEEAGDWNTYVRREPEGVAQEIVRRKPRNFFNDYEHSSYLQWRLNGPLPGTSRVLARGRFPLYIDLLNAYPDALLVEYLNILDATPQGMKALQQRRINCIVLGNHHWEKPLARYLGWQHETKGKWNRVFRDESSMMWVRTQPLYGKPQQARRAR